MANNERPSRGVTILRVAAAAAAILFFCQWWFVDADRMRWQGMMGTAFFAVAAIGDMPGVFSRGARRRPEEISKRRGVVGLGVMFVGFVFLTLGSYIDPSDSDAASSPLVWLLAFLGALIFYAGFRHNMSAKPIE